MTQTMKTRAIWPPDLKRLVWNLARAALVAAASALGAVAIAWQAQAGADPVVSVGPESPTIPVDAASFQVDVFVDQVTNPTGLGGYDLMLSFDPAIIRAISVSDSGFVLSTGNIVVCVPSQIDNTAGWAMLSCVTVPLFVGDGPTTTVPQLLATATFQPVASGSSVLSLEGTNLYDPSGMPLEVTLEHSEVTIAPTAPPSPEPEPPTVTPEPTLTPVPPPTETPFAPATLPEEAVASPPAPTATELPLPTTPPQTEPTRDVVATAAPPPQPGPPLEGAPVVGASPLPDPRRGTIPTDAPGPWPTATRVGKTVTPTTGLVLPLTGNGPGGDSSWVLPFAGGLAGVVLVSLAATLAIRAWRRRQERLAARGQ
jgi:hypothetical protein